MPTESTSVNGAYKNTHYVHPCTGVDTYGSNVAFTYTKDYRVYNDTQHRVKPDPLTDTALNKQYRRRNRPSHIPFDECETGWSNQLCPPRIYYPVYTQYKGLGGSDNYAMTGVPAGLVPTVPWSNVLLQFARDQFTSIGDSLAEYRATATMFHRYGQQMYRVAGKLKNLKRFRTRLSFCSVPLAELAYSFGVAPLVEDVFSTYEALRLRLQNPIIVDYSKTVTKYGFDKPTWSGYADVQRRASISHRVNARIELKPYETTLTVGNPSTWAWELIPFSFVVDWGIPIGQYLADLDTIRLMEGVKGTRTVKETYAAYFRIAKPNRFGQTVKGSLGKTSFKSHERILLTSVPLPSAPRWDPSQSWHKVYRALTLLIAVRGCKPVVRRPVIGPWYRYKEFYGRRS